MTKEARSIRCPEGVLGWIPWYGEEGEDGHGVLTERQRGAVEAHCAECADCRAELEMIAGAPYEIDVELPDPDRLFGEITARIAAGEAAAPEADFPSDQVTPVIPIRRQRKLEESDYEKLAAWVFDQDAEAELEAADRAAALEKDATLADEAPLAPASNVVRGPWGHSNVWAAAAAILLLALGGVGGAFFSTSGSQTDVYELAAAEATLVARPAGPQIEVIFEDSASAGEIFDSLRGFGVEIVSGPTSDGRYRLQLSAASDGLGAPSAAEAASVASQMKTASVPIVKFAEPVR